MNLYEHRLYKGCKIVRYGEYSFTVQHMETGENIHTCDMASAYRTAALLNLEYDFLSTYHHYMDVDADEKIDKV